LRHYVNPSQEDDPMKRLRLAAALVAFTAPALAQSSFFIVQDATTKKCSIVSEKPTTTTTTVVGPAGVTYTTRAEAEAGMKTVKVCESK
jgi:hypothetical protein